MNKRLSVLGVLSLVPYIYAWYLGDLRVHTIAIVVAFTAAFGLYGLAVIQVLQTGQASKRTLFLILGIAFAMQAILIFTRPTLSDDMYRYVWDGRVQAQGISPYRFPPDAPELTALRDPNIWASVNRKEAVTVYPPAAEMAFALLWRIWPDNVDWFQIAMAAGGLLAGGLLLRLLQALGRSPARVLIYLWSPLLAFETAHASHVDGLVLPLLVGAWWARVRQRDTLTGILLGLGTAIKFYPALLLPALWRPNSREGRWRMPVGFAVTVAVCYLPYLLNSGAGVIGFLPKYFKETFNISPIVGFLFTIFQRVHIDPRSGVPVLMAAALVVIGGLMMLKPAPDGESAVRRSIWMIGVFTLFSQDLFSWYMLWLLPLLAVFLDMSRMGGKLKGSFLVLQGNAWTGWWLFSGLVGLSYLFFIRWKPVSWAIWAQFLPLYAFLLIDLMRKVLKRQNASYAWFPGDSSGLKVDR
jgi:alpha-1,6-mannosyltransferase